LNLNIKYKLAFASGIPQIVNRLKRFRPVILTYHGIYDGLKNLNNMPDTFVHIDDFYSQLHFLKRNYRILDPHEFLTLVRTGSSFPPSTAFLTFDDGYESLYHLAFPILEKLRINPIVFLPSKYIEEHIPFWFDLVWYFINCAELENIKEHSGFLHIPVEKESRESFLYSWLCELKKMIPEERNTIIDGVSKEIRTNRKYSEMDLKWFYPLTPEQIKSLVYKGVQFGGHTHSHTILTVLSSEAATEEIQKNKQKVENLIGDIIYFFAYPNGKEEDFNQDIKKILADENYEMAFSLTNQRSLPSKDPLAISRLNVSPSETILSLKFHISGCGRFFKKIKGYAD
jgi:peptidoglycan/xylan/chitin deacetylase (PgdA/CDA1 family)